MKYSFSLIYVYIIFTAVVLDSIYALYFHSLIHPLLIDNLSLFLLQLFSLLPHVHFSGNYWWATCKHINRLIDPLSPTRNQTFLAATAEINPHRKSNNDHRFHSYPNLGLGRFFAESWIGSAPVMKIADCMNAEREEQYTGGYEIPYFTLIQVCDNFNADFHNKTIEYEQAISNDSLEVPKMKLG